MKHIPTLTLACLLAASGHVMAMGANNMGANNTNMSANNMNMGTPHMASSHSSTTATSEMAEGVVRKVDMKANKITIKHGEIKNIDMPPMTMVFQAKNPTLLRNLKEGDKIRFTADEIKDVLTLTSVEKVK